MSRNKAPFVPYAVILLSVIACMCCAALFYIFAQTFAQRMTPGHLPSKAASLIMVMSICSLPTGLAVYGFLFHRFGSSSSVILFLAYCKFGYRGDDRNIF